MFIVDFDRFLMGFSLAVHIVLAAAGIALPLIILIAEFLGIKYNDRHYKALAKRLTIVFVVLFAVGAASGMLVAVDISLLWPKFMSLIGQVAILPFYIEVFAFFSESIFLGIYVYSWNKFRNEYLHLITGIPIVIGAAMSGLLITMINAFMNTPTGFNIPEFISNGTVTGVDPLAVFSGPSTAIEVSHVLTTTYFTGTMIFLGYFAYMLLKSRNEDESLYYRKGLNIMLVISAIFVILSIITGIISISSLISLQPEKYAAIEGNLHPETYAPEMIGGLPVGNGSYVGYVDIPDLQSILATGNTAGAVPGLSSYPQGTWPPLIIHLFFDTMFGLGVLEALGIALVLLLLIIRGNPLSNRIILMLMIAAGAAAVLITELGWMVDELGRQPWIIYNVMLVSSAANYTASIIPAGILIVLFYALIIPFVLIALKRIFRDRPLSDYLVLK